MGSGQLIYWGLGMLILVPVIMGFLGDTFNQDIDVRENQNIPQETYDRINIEQNQTWIESVFTPDPTGWISNVINGYSLFPWWINIFITLIPLILLIRGIVSTSA